MTRETNSPPRGRSPAISTRLGALRRPITIGTATRTSTFRTTAWRRTSFCGTTATFPSPMSPPTAASPGNTTAGATRTATQSAPPGAISTTTAVSTCSSGISATRTIGRTGPSSIATRVRRAVTVSKLMNTFDGDDWQESYASPAGGGLRQRRRFGPVLHDGLRDRVVRNRQLPPAVSQRRELELHERDRQHGTGKPWTDVPGGVGGR